jgi:hypothetical protein
MSIQPALNTTIYTALSGTTNAGTRVYYLLAPDKATLPYIIFDYINEGDDNDNPHRAKNCVISIKAYAVTPAEAGVIDGQIDIALHHTVLSVSGWTNFQSRRENGYSLVDTDSAGRKTYMSGADYRFRMDK